MDANSYTVYIHTNKLNGKVYVGITHLEPQQRWKKNGSGYLNRDTYFAKAIIKYGWNNFNHEIIATNLSAEQASEMEIALIEKYNSTNPEFGYNYEKGGLCNNEYMRRKKISSSIVGENHPFFNRHHTEETRRKLSELNSGVNHRCYGKHLPEETRNKISKKLRGNKNGIKHAEECKKPIRCIETGEVYESLMYVENVVGIHHSAISMVLHGKRQTAGGYHWEFAA